MKTHIQQTLETCLADNEVIPLANGFELAFMGVARQFNVPFAVYDRTRCLALLMEQGMSVEEAEEYMSYNTEGAWVGENTPAFMVPAMDDWNFRQDMTISVLSTKMALYDTLLRILVDFVNPELARDEQAKDICLDALHAVKKLLKTEEGHEL
jgi:hypothetical protein